MIYFTNLNWQGRIELYLKRGFQKAEAEILVLMEEAAAGLFSAFPDRFVLVGGATLVLFYASPRLSRDLDLLAKTDQLPPAVDVQKVVASSIQPLAEIFGWGKLDFRQQQDSKDFIRIWVESNQRPLFSIDLTRIGGTVLQAEIVEQRIAGDHQKTIVAPSANYLLFQKCVTFLDRRYPKARDAFDIDILKTKGARLDDNLKAHLEDFMQMKELDADLIRSRIARIDPKLCTVELRPILPQEWFRELANDDFNRLRKALESVFSSWIYQRTR
jgi:hypothetical protein